MKRKTGKQNRTEKHLLRKLLLSSQKFKTSVTS